jgi:thymidine kinase
MLIKTKDVRYEDDYSRVVSHDLSNWLEAVACDRLNDAFDQALRADVIGIDEGQFFPDLKAFCEEMANSGKIVIVAALDSDYRREEFLGVCSLIAKAEKVSKLTSVCHLCKDDASFTARLSEETELKVIGGMDKYRPVCRPCHASINR